MENGIKYVEAKNKSVACWRFPQYLEPALDHRLNMLRTTVISKSASRRLPT